MKVRWIPATGIVLLMAGALPASAQMMGGETGMMDMMGRQASESGTIGCPGMAGQPVAFGYEGPWISLALAHAREVGLNADQAKGLTALRDEFQKEAVPLTGEIRAFEAEVQRLSTREPVDLQAVETKIRAIAGLEADLRIGRLKTLEKGRALLTPEQRQALTGIAQSMGRMHGAFMMGGPSQGAR